MSNLASLCAGPVFYFLLLSHHPFFEHLLESIAVIFSVTCLSRNKINCGITVMFESFDIFTSNLLLNFRGALAFMFCSTKRNGKRDTTLSYHTMNIAILQVLMFHIAYYYIGIFHSLHYYWAALVAYFLLWITWVPYHVMRIYTSHEANVFVKVSFIALSCHWIAWGQAIS